MCGFVHCLEILLLHALRIPPRTDSHVTDCCVGMEFILSALVFTLTIPPTPTEVSKRRVAKLHVACMAYTTNGPGSVEKEERDGDREYMNTQRPPPLVIPFLRVCS